jgi:hypothetical protein
MVDSRHGNHGLNVLQIVIRDLNIGGGHVMIHNHLKTLHQAWLLSSLNKNNKAYISYIQ